MTFSLDRFKATRPYIDDRFDCVDCGRDTNIPPREYYAVHDELWSEVCAVEPVLPDESGMLCIGCLESRLGRELCAADFKDCGLTRHPRRGSSKRLLNRLRRR